MKLEHLVPELPFDRKIFAFYSYKGGVGRTMALANVAAVLSTQHAARSESRVEILCMDLDLDAPGLPAFLPPAPGREEVRGFLGLLLDHDGDGPLSAPAEALSPGGRYLYPVAGTSNLFVLSAGNLAAGERTEALSLLRRLLKPAREETDPTRVADAAPFFGRLRTVLRQRFSYVLVDSRTGLADEAFATTVLIADAMVLFFRPNSSQVLGIHEVLTRFLFQHGLKSTAQDVPVIPVLSPLPTSSDPRLREIRRLATEHTFKWLGRTEPDPAGQPGPYAPARPKLIELPFDSAVEIGERLLMPLSPDEEADDPGAPLYQAYLELAAAVQKQNARHDSLGAQRIEIEHYRANRPREAFDYLLAQIAQEPDHEGLWHVVWDRYRNAILQDRAMGTRFWHFCEAIAELPDRGPVPAFYSNLWLSEFFAETAPELCLKRIVRLWQIALENRRASMLYDGLERLVRYHGEGRPGTRTPEELPDHEDTVAAFGYATLRTLPGAEGLWWVLSRLAKFYGSTPEEPERLRQVLQDQLQVAADPATRAVVLKDLGDAWLSVGGLREAWSAYLAAVSLKGVSEETRDGYAELVLRLGDREQAELAIETCVAPVRQPVWRVVYEIRAGASVEEVDAKLSTLAEVAGADDRWLRGWSLLHHRRFEEAAAVLEEGIAHGRTDVADLALPSLARWLAHGTALSAEVTTWALSAIARAGVGSSIFDGPAVSVALAAAPERVVGMAVEQLSRPQWRLHFVGWALLACTSSEGRDRYRSEIEKQLRETPLLARYLRRAESFPLLRFVCEKHLAVGAIGEESSPGFREVLDLVESWPVDEAVEVSPYELPTPISDDGDQRLEEMVHRWLSVLKPILDHPVMGDVVRTIVEGAATNAL